MIVARWAEYQRNLLNKDHISDTAIQGDLPTQPIIQKLCDPPSFDEVEKAILCLNDNKAAGPDNIPAWQHSDNIRSTDGVLRRNKELILARLAEYLQNLLNKVHISDSGFLDDLPTLPIIPKRDEPSSFDEVEMAILRLKYNKTTVPDNIQCTACVLIKNEELILSWLAEYLQNLLNKVHITDPGFLADLTTQPIIPKLCDPPSLDEEEKVILCLNDNKTAGPDNIPAWQHSDNIRSTDGVLIKNKELILARLAEYLQNLLNKVHITNMDFLDDLPTLQIIAKLDDPSSFDEVEKDIFCLKDNKTADPDKVPTWKHSDKIRSTDGVLIKNKELILAWLAEYLQNLLNNIHITDPGFHDDLTTLQIIPKLDEPSSFDEV